MKKLHPSEPHLCSTCNYILFSKVLLWYSTQVLVDFNWSGVNLHIEGLGASWQRNRNGHNSSVYESGSVEGLHSLFCRIPLETHLILKKLQWAMITLYCIFLGRSDSRCRFYLFVYFCIQKSNVTLTLQTKLIFFSQTVRGFQVIEAGIRDIFLKSYLSLSLSVSQGKEAHLTLHSLKMQS